MITYNFWSKTKQYLSGNILLLGDQEMDYPGAQGDRGAEWIHLQKKGGADEYTILDLDINGKADVEYDLASYKSSPEQLDGYLPFNTIADFGTLEHVEDIPNALRNLHAWLEVGGIRIHINPNHGYFDGIHENLPRLTKNFWADYATIAGYDVLEIGHIRPYDETAEICDYAVLQKTDTAGPTKKALQKLLNDYV